MVILSPISIAFFQTMDGWSQQEINDHSFVFWNSVYESLGITRPTNHDLCKRQFVEFRKLARLAMLTPGLTANLEVGAILSTARGFFLAYSARRYIGFSDIVGEDAIIAFDTFVLTGGGAGAGGGAGPGPGGGAGAGGGVGAGGAPRTAGVLPVPPVLVGPTTSGVKVISAKESIAAAQAKLNFLPGMANTNTCWRGPTMALIPPDAVNLVGELEHDVLGQNLCHNDVIAVVQRVDGLTPPFDYSIFAVQAVKAYVHEIQGARVVLTRVCFLANSGAAKTDTYHEVPDKVELERQLLTGLMFLRVRTGGVMFRTISTHHLEERKKQEAANITGKFLHTLDNRAMGIVSTRDRGPESVAKCTIGSRISNYNVGNIIAKANSWAYFDAEQAASDMIHALELQNNGNALENVFSNNSLVAFRNVVGKNLITGKIFRMIYVEFSFPNISTFTRDWDHFGMMMHHRNTVVVSLEYAQQILMIVAGEEWKGCFQDLIHEVNRNDAAEDEFGHLQYYIGYFAQELEKLINSFFKMLAMNKPEAFDHLNGNSPVNFWDPLNVITLLKKLIKDTLKPKYYLNNMFGSTIQSGLRGRVEQKQTSTKRDQSASSVKSGSSNGSDGSSNLSLSAPTGLRDRAKRPSVGFKKPLTGKPIGKGNPIKKEPNTISQDMCYKHFLYTIRANEKNGSRSLSCKGKCGYLHGLIPAQPEARRTMAIRIFKGRLYMDHLARALKALE